MSGVPAGVWRARRRRGRNEESPGRLASGWAFKWRGRDLNLRPRGYEPRELPGCSTPRHFWCVRPAGGLHRNHSIGRSDPAVKRQFSLCPLQPPFPAATRPSFRREVNIGRNQGTDPKRAWEIIAARNESKIDLPVMRETSRRPNGCPGEAASPRRNRCPPAHCPPSAPPIQFQRRGPIWPQMPCWRSPSVPGHVRAELQCRRRIAKTCLRRCRRRPGAMAVGVVGRALRGAGPVWPVCWSSTGLAVACARGQPAFLRSERPAARAAWRRSTTCCSRSRASTAIATTITSPRNSYLCDVLARRTGLPITLSIVYMAVAARAGLKACKGSDWPGHFVVRCADPGEPADFFDPFAGGDLVLSLEACRRRIGAGDRQTGGGDRRRFRPASPRGRSPSACCVI